jgi:hypothetical protein
LHACASAPLLREDVLALVDAELARAGATGRAVVVTDRSPAHCPAHAREREAAQLIVVGSSRGAAPTASSRATTQPRRCIAPRARSLSLHADSPARREL